MHMESNYNATIIRAPLFSLPRAPKILGLALISIMFSFDEHIFNHSL